MNFEKESMSKAIESRFKIKQITEEEIDNIFKFCITKFNFEDNEAEEIILNLIQYAL